MTQLRNFRHNKTIVAGVISLALAGCSGHGAISNLEPVAEGKSYQAEYRSHDGKAKIVPASATLNETRCTPEAAAADAAPSVLGRQLLSPGDLVDVVIGTDELLSGKYEVASDGMLEIRDLVAVPAHGRSPQDVAGDVARALVRAKLYGVAPAVSVRLADYGAVRVFVSGAVFEPGDVSLGGSASADKDGTREDAVGAATLGRRLSRALQSAGGVRPDADLSRVTIQRGSRRMVVDARPALSGRAFDDMILLEGDQVSVASRGCFQAALLVPSAVSPVGAKVFMSNLTEPATSNASAAIGKETRELRYGTRMLQALVGMNCVGGSKLTNAGRTAILYSRNPESGKSIPSAHPGAAQDGDGSIQRKGKAGRTGRAARPEARSWR